MSALRPETRRMIELAREGDRPRPGVQRRVERALAANALLVGGAAAGTALTTSAAASSALFKPLFVVSVALGVVVSGGYGGAQLFNLGRPSRPAPAAVVPSALAAPGARAAAPASASPQPAITDAVPPPEAPAPAAVATRAVTGPRRARSGASAASGENTLGAETSALRAAQKALRDGDTARALGLLSDEAALHPNGALVQERAAARVLALCQAGNVNAARQEAREFEALYATSPLLARVRAACAEPRVAP